MLDEEKRQMLEVLARNLDPDYDKKITVEVLSYRLATPVGKVINEVRRMGRPHAGSFTRLTGSEASEVERRLSSPALQPVDELAQTVAELAMEIKIPVQDVIKEVTARRVNGSGISPKLRLYSLEVDILVNLFDDRSKQREALPVVYKPSKNGGLTFETYERIPRAQRDDLEAKGFIPKLTDLVHRPNARWVQVKNHYLHLTDAGKPLSNAASGDNGPQRNSAKSAANQNHSPANTEEFIPFPNTISGGNSLIPKMQALLDRMAPMEYAHFFSLFRALLALDGKVAKEIANGAGYYSTDRNHAAIIDEACKYGFGIFAYQAAGEKLSRKSSPKHTRTKDAAIQALMRLRPMHQGILTDAAHKRFVVWRVGELFDFVELRFEDMHDWLDGLSTGMYVPLTTHHTRISDASNLSPRDATLVTYMVAAADNLRQGNAQQTASRSVPITGAAQPPRKNVATAPKKAAEQRSLGYRAVSTWLVPITVFEGQVETSLDKEFFNAGGNTSPHQVRDHYRRPKGSGLYALKTEHVSGHTRGGTGLFPEPRLLPVVTILKR